MSIDTKITRKLNDNCVQVEAIPSSGQIKYYKVPIDKADEFCSVYKKNAKNSSHKNDIITFVAAVTAAFIGSALFGKINSKLRMVGAVATCLAGYISTNYAVNSITEKKYKKFLQEYNVEEIGYSKKKII